MSDIWLRHLASGLSGSGIVAYIWDVSADRYEWNGDLTALLGVPRQDYPQTSLQFQKLINPQHLLVRMAAMHDFLNGGSAGGRSTSISYKIARADGTQADIVENVTLETGESGRDYICGFLKAAPEAADTPAASRNAEMGPSVAPHGFHVTHQGRRLLIRRIEEWNESAADRETEGYLLALGLDRLTFINESFGASYTDELIDRAGARLQEIVGKTGYVCRIDGDVFGIFFHDAPVNEMALVANHILNSFFQSPLRISAGLACVSLSVGGVALRDTARVDAASLVTKAEMAMQAAKDKGRCCFVSYPEAATRSENYRHLLESADTFLQAVKENRIMMAYQPIMETQTQAVTFHECLIRLVDRKGRFIPAGDFVPAIEAMGLTRFVDQYAIRMAIQELSQFPELNLSVNVSNLTLSDQDWLRGVVLALRDRRSIATRLIFEITETAISRDPHHTRRVIRTLKDLGCRVALDDFGAGFTAFSQLRDLDIDIVKIDKSFVRNINENQNLLFIRTLQSLADGVNVKTVGEGAETMADVHQLTSESVNYIQGYVYGYPKVERVWLPKEHQHRQFIMPSGGPPSREDINAIETMRDVADIGWLARL